LLGALLGDGLFDILRWLKVDMFVADLDAAWQFLCENILNKEKSEYIG